jgi:threonine aldolase
MRQSGVLAACGIISLEKMTKRLHIDHENARYLGDRLAEIPGIAVDKEKIRINMVFWNFRQSSPRETEQANFDSDAFVAFMLKRRVKVSGDSADEYRFVTHNDVSREDIDRVVAALREYVAAL